MRPVQLLHVSDVHFDARRTLAGALRTDSETGHNAAIVNTARCLGQIVAQAPASDIVSVVTGDVFDTDTPDPLEERYAIEFVLDLRRRGPVVIIAGNHDIPMTAGTADALECLRHRSNIHVVDRADVIDLRTATGALVRLACVPYPKRNEHVHTDAKASREERNAAVSASLVGLISGLNLECDRRHRVAGAADATVLLYHGTVAGALTGVQPRALSDDIMLPPGVFEGWDFAACGHIHKMQRVGTNAYYAGSPDRVDSDEAADYKGGLLVTVQDHAATVKPLRAEGARSYVTLDAPTALVAQASQFVPGTVYRVKAKLTADDAAAVRRRVAELASAGVWIHAAIDVVTSSRVRDAEARVGETADALLRRWLPTHPTLAPPETHERVLSLNLEITGGT